MKLFTCDNCQQVVYFESVQCTRCGRKLAFRPDLMTMSALEPDERRCRPCRNDTDFGVCNWAVEAGDASDYCRACRLNHMIPNLSDAKAKEGWHRMEMAKRRLLYTALGLGLPVETKAENPTKGLAFDFLQDGAEGKVFTGHSDGLITINVAEADNPLREKIRERLGETYRTVLGHLRHESGHYYWERLVDGTPRLEAFRKTFGDERASYEEAREAHYEHGPPADWWDSFVSAYATMHPWEDWAETWAHYFHIVDGLQTARAHGLSVQAAAKGVPVEPKVSARRLDPHSFDDLIKGWIPLTMALNSMNRSIGGGDAYPFVLTEAAIDKLRFVHDVVEANAAGADARRS